MVWFVSIAVAIVLCGVAFLFGRAMRSEAEPGKSRSRPRSHRDRARRHRVRDLGGRPTPPSPRSSRSRPVTSPSSTSSVRSSAAAAKVSSSSGPWQEIRTESIRVQRARFDNVSGFSAETQDVIISTTVNYQVDPGAVEFLYRTVGPNWFDILVEPRINQYFKAETVKYNTVDIAPNRETIRENVRAALAADLRDFSVTVQDLLIDNVDFKRRLQAFDRREADRGPERAPRGGAHRAGEGGSHPGRGARQG